MSIADIMARADLTLLEACRRDRRSRDQGLLSAMQKARNTHSAVFAEVNVEDQLGGVRVTRLSLPWRQGAFSTQRPHAARS